MILNAKAESAGREVMAVDPRDTSRTCPECGHTAKENRPAQEKFHCLSCGHRAHADAVGAANVLRAGPVRRDATRHSEKPPCLRGAGVTDSRAQRAVPAGADPLTRQLLRQLAARAVPAEPSGLPDGGQEEGAGRGPDAAGALRLLAAWHRRGTEVGFPELTALPRPSAGG